MCCWRGRSLDTDFDWFLAWDCLVVFSGLRLLTATFEFDERRFVAAILVAEGSRGLADCELVPFSSRLTIEGGSSSAPSFRWVEIALGRAWPTVST